MGAQSVEIRVTDTPVDSGQAANTLLTSGDSSEVNSTSSVIHSLISSSNRFVEVLEALWME